MPKSNHYQGQVNNVRVISRVSGVLQLARNNQSEHRPESVTCPCIQRGQHTHIALCMLQNILMLHAYVPYVDAYAHVHHLYTCINITFPLLQELCIIHIKNKIKLFIIIIIIWEQTRVSDYEAI